MTYTQSEVFRTAHEYFQPRADAYSLGYGKKNGINEISATCKRSVCGKYVYTKIAYKG